jgi:hypothetical protein
MRIPGRAANRSSEFPVLAALGRTLAAPDCHELRVYRYAAIHFNRYESLKIRNSILGSQS